MRARWQIAVGLLACAALVAIAPRAWRAYGYWDASTSTHAASDVEQVGILRAVLGPEADLLEPGLGARGHARWMFSSESVVVEECESTDALVGCVHVGRARTDLRALPARLRMGLIQANRAVSPMPDPGLARIVFKSRSEIRSPFAGNDALIVAWNDFHARNPGVLGYVYASRAVVSDDTAEAMVYVELHCHAECASGQLVHLVKGDAGWSVRRSVVLWIS